MPPKTQIIDFENKVELCGNLPREEYLCPSEVGSTITQVVLRETRGQYESEFCVTLFARQGSQSQLACLARGSATGNWDRSNIPTSTNHRMARH